MKRSGATALDAALARGQAASEGLPALVEEARTLQTQARECADLLLQIRGRVAAVRLSAADQRPLRRDFRRRAGGLRRAVGRRIAWLSLRVFWRRIRVWVLLALLLAALALAAVWAVQNRDRLAEGLANLLGVSSPTEAPTEGQEGGGVSPESPVTVTPAPASDAQPAGAP